jgi:hypothetical protein
MSASAEMADPPQDPPQDWRPQSRGPRRLPSLLEVQTRASPEDPRGSQLWLLPFSPAMLTTPFKLVLLRIGYVSWRGIRTRTVGGRNSYPSGTIAAWAEEMRLLS